MKKVIILMISFFAVSYFAKSQSCTNCDANNVITPANYSSALGIENTSTGQGSFAAGKFNTADNVFTTALGFQNMASGQISVAAGNNIIASGVYSLGFGSYLEATGSRSMVIGTGAAFGNPLTNSNPNSLMIGFGSNKPTLFIGTAPESDETGAIGIGNVTSPLSKVHIKADYGEEAALLVEPNTWNSDGWAEVRVGNSLNAVRGSYTYGMQFKTDKNYIFNSTNANVGIGVLNPHEKLEVSGNIKTTGFMLQDGQQAANKVLQSNENGLASWVDPMTLIVDDGDWVINGNNMYSSVTGNIGIGVLSPVEKLDVNGTVKSVGFKLIDGNQAAGKILQSDASGNASWTNLPPAGDDDWTISGNNVYRLNGNVGIGIATPQESLHVNGNIIAVDLELTGELIAAEMNISNFEVGFLTVTQKIEAAEIEVKDLSKWKDEVFEDQYPLAPLSEVEQYIKEHKHLPDIPSEAEVLANGYNVGDMDALLLQKIEELTLYVIELEKKINRTK